MAEVFPQKMSVKLVIDDATRARRDSYSRRSIRYYWKTEVVVGREVEYEHVQTDATGPTPCIDYITITNRIAVQFSVYIRATKRNRDICAKSVKIEERKSKTDKCISLLVGNIFTTFNI